MWYFIRVTIKMLFYSLITKELQVFRCSSTSIIAHLNARGQTTYSLLTIFIFEFIKLSLNATDPHNMTCIYIWCPLRKKKPCRIFLRCKKKKFFFSFLQRFSFREGKKARVEACVDFFFLHILHLY